MKTKRTRVAAPGRFRYEVRFLTDTDTGERFLLCLGRVTEYRPGVNEHMAALSRYELIRRAIDKAQPGKRRRAYLEELIRRDTPTEGTK